MGYFGKQIYNEPMSMYVDPRLDILANSLQAVQKRHDENYAQMSALDLMAHNTKVAEGDRGIKDAALGKLKSQSEAIAASGDYAYAMPRIGAAVRDWSGNEDLIAAKDNRTRIEEAEKTRQAMRAAGHIDLDFAPADNWTTIDPTTGKRRTYTSKLEKQLDYDTRAQEVSKLLANTADLGLTPANIRDYLQSGSITGISDSRVRANLEGAIQRFMVSPEGDQMKRKLTQIDKMDAGQADDYIANYLYNVGKAQVHQKVDMNYQVNAPAVQRENREDQQAFDLERDAINHQQALALEKMRYDKAMDLQKAKDAAEGTTKAAKAKAEKEAEMAVAPSAIFNAAAGSTNADNTFGTNITTESAADVFFPSVNIKDPETENTFKGMRVPMQVATLGGTYAPETGEFTKDAVNTAKEFYIRESRLKQAKEELNTLNQRIPHYKANPELINLDPNVKEEVSRYNSLNEEVQRLERGYSDGDLKAIELVQRANGKSPKEIENAVKTYKEKYKHKGIATPGGKEREVAEKYKTAFENDGAKRYESIGKKLNGTIVDATFSNAEPQNTYRVDGDLYGNFTTKMKGSDLKEKLDNDELQWAKENNLIIGGQEGVTDDKYYDVNFVSKMPESTNIYEAFDNKVMGTTDAAKNHAEYIKQTAKIKEDARDMRIKMDKLESNPNVSKDPTKPKFFREEVKTRLSNKVKEQEAEALAKINTITDAAQKQTYLDLLAKQKNEALLRIAEVDKFNDMGKREKEAYIKYLQSNGI